MTRRGTIEAWSTCVLPLPSPFGQPSTADRSSREIFLPIVATSSAASTVVPLQLVPGCLQISLNDENQSSRVDGFIVPN